MVISPKIKKKHNVTVRDTHEGMRSSKVCVLTPGRACSGG